ncbi:MAG TPA: hypothetical protein EYM99_06115 [Alphaproteobacteria bacterium]|nr:hypothetical protein [Alphaproteobacteria bacterium]
MGNIGDAHFDPMATIVPQASLEIALKPARDIHFARPQTTQIRLIFPSFSHATTALALSAAWFRRKWQKKLQFFLALAQPVRLGSFAANEFTGRTLQGAPFRCNSYLRHLRNNSRVSSPQADRESPAHAKCGP